MFAHLLLGVRYQRSGNLEIRVECGACGESGAPSLAYDQMETLMLFHAIPIFKATRNTFVKCGSCGVKLTSSLSCEELRNCNEIDLRHFVTYRDSFIVKFLAITSLLCCLCPFLGTVLAAITLICVWRSPTWVRTVTIIALVISLVPDLFLLGGLLMGMK